MTLQEELHVLDLAHPQVNNIYSRVLDYLSEVIEIDKFQQMERELENEIDNLESKLKAAQDRIDELEDELESANEFIEDLKYELREAV